MSLIGVIEKSCNGCRQKQRERDVESDEEFGTLTRCPVAACEEMLCHSDDCQTNKCVTCEWRVCESHQRKCEHCDSHYCTECRRFNLDREHKVCNPCWRELALSLRCQEVALSDVESSIDDDDDDDGVMDMSRCEVAALRRAYANSSLSEAVRRQTVYNICVKRWQSSLSAEELALRAEPRAEHINADGEVVERALKRSRTE